MERDSQQQHETKYSERRAFPFPFHLCELPSNQSTYSSTVTLVLDNFIILITKYFSDLKYIVIDILLGWQNIKRNCSCSQFNDESSFFPQHFFIGN